MTIVSTNAETAQLAALTGSQGNYALYDPHFYVAPSTEPIAEELGLFDLGILHHISSVQGYGSIVSLLYEDATSSHAVGNFDLQALVGSTGNVLDLHTLLTSPQYLVQSIPDHGAIPILTEDGPRFDIGTGERVLRGQAPAQTGPWFILPGTERTWFLPGIVKGASATLVLDPTVRPQPEDDRGRLRQRRRPIGQRDSKGAEGRGRSPQRRRASTWWRSAPARRRAGYRGPRRRRRRESVRFGQDPARRHPADGPVGSPLAIRGDGRSPAGVHQHRDPRTHLGRGFRERRSGRAAACRARARQRLRLPSETPRERSSRSPTPALLVRSTAFAPDWYAEVAPESGGPSDLVPVRALGVVQAVPVPAGHFVVTWVYRPGTARLGALSSFIATLVFLVLCALAWFRRRARAASGAVA